MNKAEWINGALSSAFPDDDGEKDIFPLHTVKSLSERWGVRQNVVVNWRSRLDDFPKPIEGLVVSSRQHYPLHEVERFERSETFKRLSSK